MIRAAQDYSNEVDQQQQQYYDDEVSFNAPSRAQGQGLYLGPVKVKGKLAPGQGLVKGAGGAKGAVRRNKKGPGLAPTQDPPINTPQQHNHNNQNNPLHHHHNNNYHDGNTPNHDLYAAGPGLGQGLAQGPGPGQIDPSTGVGHLVGEEALAQTPGAAQAVMASVRRPVPHYRSLIN